MGLRGKIAALLAAVMVWGACRAQQPVEYFILGTLNEYMGRMYIDKKQFQIDRYYPYEQALADYVCSLIEQKYGKGSCRLTPVKNRVDLYCKPLYPVIDSLYKRDVKVIETREQALAYMHGRYLRNGTAMGDSLCYITATNPDAGRIFYKAAMMIGLKDLSLNVLNNVPPVTRLSFTPTEEFLELMHRDADLKAKIAEALDAMVNEKYKEYKQP